ncbi:L-lactate permease [Gleimia hominis]|uniref:L-lactate permease n=1 Tax=Gleimia hominis TaxID=595468 RepID=A0ABU3I8K9_9ACTO|nr:L-lactate permease [Gleimia hominis]MDT3766704.1 L-lactate permease [Gleimia hominis]
MPVAVTFTPGEHIIGGSLFISALVGLLPLLVFFILLGVFKVKTHWCALISLATALVVAVIGFKMPVSLALLSGSQGLAFSFTPILYIIITAVWLYNLSEGSGRSADVRAAFNVVGAGDRRIQALLLAFSFCGILEGLAGFGAPVAIVCAMLVAIGVEPIKAAVVTITGNAINVGFGAVAIPVTTAAGIGEQNPLEVAAQMGIITPFIAGFVPLGLLVLLDGKRGLKQLWPVALASGIVTALGHWAVATYFSYELTAILASLLGFAAVTGLLQVWKPTTPETERTQTDAKLTGKRATLALMPYWLVVLVFGVAKLWTIGIDLPAALKATDIKFGWPGLDGHLLTADGAVNPSTQFSLATLSSPGTLIALTAIVVTFVYAKTANKQFPFTVGKGFKTLGTTIYGLRIAILTIATVMMLAYVMNFSGQTGVIGAWMSGAGGAFVLISPVLGWIGTAVTGSATSANALFADLQTTAAHTVGANPSLLLSANTIGGGIGKIVSPQNLAIAAGAIDKPNSEPELLRRLAPISALMLVVLALLVGLHHII